jgi:hypothetical protein
MRPSARRPVFRPFIPIVVAVVLGFSYTPGAVSPNEPATVVPPTLARSRNAPLARAEDRSRDQRALSFVLAIAVQLRSGRQ